MQPLSTFMGQQRSFNYSRLPSVSDRRRSKVAIELRAARWSLQAADSDYISRKMDCIMCQLCEISGLFQASVRSDKTQQKHPTRSFSTLLQMTGFLSVKLFARDSLHLFTSVSAQRVHLLLICLFTFLITPEIYFNLPNPTTLSHKFHMGTHRFYS